ncbi:MAG: elongation factor G [Cyanobacteriota bacterium]|nr:elongation factor G [Cyanobacteriota bacterium]
MIPRERIRNIGISAHIDAGKTTLSERILYYTGKIRQIEEVRGGGKGATMDSMELEFVKGITIASAATTCQWNDTQINLIDTPGHVDFTIEVERALRVLDGAVMVLCAVAGVQSQSVTVDRQMKRYRVPRVAFINKMDRPGANPFGVVRSLREKLGLNPVALQYPIGLEKEFVGVIDLIEMRANYFEGENGEIVASKPIPKALEASAREAREKMLDDLSMFSDELMAAILDEATVTPEFLWEVVRRATLSLELTPVLMGSAFDNKGVQNLLDAIARYLPSPLDREVTAETGGIVIPDLDGPFVALAFKLTQDEFGQLTYLRLYSGTLKPGDRICNTRTQDVFRVGRLVRLHADARQEIAEAAAGDIVATLGANCASGDTLCSEGTQVSLEQMFVPDPVITLAVAPATQEDAGRMSKALNRFVKEDPTLRVGTDAETGATLISGMGELHLEIYLERMQREYGVRVDVGAPSVAYRETISQTARFDYTLKKQSGGPGQYARVIGRIEPIEESTEEPFVFENRVVGGSIPSQFVPACEKGFRDAIATGKLAGYPVVGVKVILEGGAFHAVDSKETGFRYAAMQGFAQAFANAKPLILEPMMRVEVETPPEFVGRIQGNLMSRRGTMLGSQIEENSARLEAEVPLVEMFGYSTGLRSLSQGMASFSMELSGYRPAPASSIAA